MLFNNSRKFDFLPQLEFSNGLPLDVVKEFKLLGVIVTSNLNWQSQVNNMCAKAYRRMWIIRRLKKFGVCFDNLLLVYSTQIRCIVEFAVAAWNPNLTKAQITQMERIQKYALAIILAEDYVSYNNALPVTGLCTLESRRKSL